MEPEKKPNGALVGLVVIIIILIVGGLYLWKSNKMEESPVQSDTVSNQDSAELSAMELELENTDTSTGVDSSTIY